MLTTLVVIIQILKNMKHSGNKSYKGFTLIELLVVVAIIGILAAVGVVAYNGYTASAKKKAVETNFSIVVKYLKSELMKCELNSSNKILEGLIDCNDRALVIAGNAGANGAKDFREKRITESEFDQIKDEILQTL